MTELVEFVRVVSFGYLHGGPPEADVVLDVRGSLRDPHVDPTFRQLDGTNLRVIDRVLKTPGAIEIANGLCVLACTMQPVLVRSQRSLLIAIGCAGGRHRSVVLANYVSHQLMVSGRMSAVGHRDLTKPVVPR